MWQKYALCLEPAFFCSSLVKSEPAWLHLRAAMHICYSHSCTPCNSRLMRFFVEFTPCMSSKLCPKVLLGCGAATSDVCGKDRTGPILCGVRLCCSQSQLRHQPAWTYDKMVDGVELFDSKMARRIELALKPVIFKNIHLHA